jgi:hypothetical protein
VSIPPDIGKGYDKGEIRRRLVARALCIKISGRGRPGLHLAFNLLDTPGHQDFSEDTYRALTAVDSAVMVLDAAPNGAKRGIEGQTTNSSRCAGCATCRSSVLSTSSTATAETRSTALLRCSRS